MIRFAIVTHSERRRYLNMSKPPRICFAALIIFISLILFTSPYSASKSIHLEAIKLPSGFQIAVFADNIPNARSMVLSPNGVLFVGSRREDKARAVIDWTATTMPMIYGLLPVTLTCPTGLHFVMVGGRQTAIKRYKTRIKIRYRSRFFSSRFVHDSDSPSWLRPCGPG